MNKKDGFSSSKGKIEYSGNLGIFHTGSGDYTLNDEPMEKHKTYDLKDGDIIRDVGSKDSQAMAPK